MVARSYAACVPPRGRDPAGGAALAPPRVGVLVDNIGIFEPTPFEAITNADAGSPRPTRSQP